MHNPAGRSLQPHCFPDVWQDRQAQRNTKELREPVRQTLQAGWLALSSSAEDSLWLSSNSGQRRTEGFVHHLSNFVSEIQTPFQLYGWMGQMDVAWSGWMSTGAPRPSALLYLVHHPSQAGGTRMRLCTPTTLTCPFWAVDKIRVESKQALLRPPSSRTASLYSSLTHAWLVEDFQKENGFSCQIYTIKESLKWMNSLKEKPNLG